MTGLRAVGWSAGVSAVAGTLALLLCATLLPTGGPGASALSGATFATVERRPVPVLVVTSLRTGGAEARAGLRVGDTVVAVNGIPRPSRRVLERELARGGALRLARHGKGVALTVGRGR